MSPRVSGAIPGLLRRGSPVVETGECGTKGAIGTVVTRAAKPGDCGLRVWWQTPAELEGMVTSVTHGTALDLSDPTGMDHGARWLTERVGLTNANGTAPMWRRSGAWWRLDTWDDEADFGNVEAEESGGVRTLAIPGISALTSPAEALALAIEHVARGAK